MKRGACPFLAARLAEVERRLAKIRVQRRVLGKAEPSSAREAREYRERRLAKMREVIMTRLREETWAP